MHDSREARGKDRQLMWSQDRFGSVLPLVSPTPGL